MSISEKAPTERQVINPWTWQEEFGFAQAVAVRGAERVIYCAGQASVDADGNPLHEEDFGAQLTQALDNLEAVLRECGSGLSDVVRLTVYTSDVDGMFAQKDEFVARMKESGCSPAMSLVGVARLAQAPLLVEVEATAVIAGTAAG